MAQDPYPLKRLPLPSSMYFLCRRGQKGSGFYIYFSEGFFLGYESAH